jgi:hypothetical protein
MKLLSNIMKYHKKIVFNRMYDYYNLLNIETKVINYYDLYMVFYNAVDDHRTYVRLHDPEAMPKLYIEKIHGILPYMTILW